MDGADFRNGLGKHFESTDLRGMRSVVTGDYTFIMLMLHIGRNMSIEQQSSRLSKQCTLFMPTTKFLQYEIFVVVSQITVAEYLFGLEHITTFEYTTRKFDSIWRHLRSVSMLFNLYIDNIIFAFALLNCASDSCFLFGSSSDHTELVQAGIHSSSKLISVRNKFAQLRTPS